METYSLGSFLPKRLRKAPIVGSAVEAVRLEFPSVPLAPMPWHLWGLTLGTISGFLAFGARPRLDWPRARCNNALGAWGFVYPYHGFSVLANDARREPGRAANRVRYVAALLAVVAAVVSLACCGCWTLLAAARWALAPS